MLCTGLNILHVLFHLILTMILCAQLYYFYFTNGNLRLREVKYIYKASEWVNWKLDAGLYDSNFCILNH